MDHILAGGWRNQRFHNNINSCSNGRVCIEERKNQVFFVPYQSRTLPIMKTKNSSPSYPSLVFLCISHCDLTAKRRDGKIYQRQFGLRLFDSKARCLKGRMTKAVWPTAVCRRQNDAQPGHPPPRTPPLAHVCTVAYMKRPLKGSLSKWNT